MIIYQFLHVPAQYFTAYFPFFPTTRVIISALFPTSHVIISALFPTSRVIIHLLRVGWRNLFSSCAVVSVFGSGGK